MSKVAVLGLSGFAPELVERWLGDLPELGRMQSEGVWGRMQSTVPPGMAQAWTSALSGKNPGVFGFWDFTYRDDFSYEVDKTIDCKVKDQRVKCLYNILPLWGEKITTINVPVTWPPPHIPGGLSISCLMTPGLAEGFTWPKSLEDEIQELVGDYILDAAGPGENYLTMEKEAVEERCQAMDAQRFTLLKHFMGKRQCDCVITGILGPERMSHLFYRFFDEKHRQYSQDPQYSIVLHDYYVWIDQQIGHVRQMLDDHTALFIFSDYSIQRLDGWVNLNEWLIQEGYLILEKYPSKPVSFEGLNVEWAETKAWAMGSSGHVYLNVKGREPEGIIELDQYDGATEELISKIKAIPNEEGNALETHVIKGKEAFSGPFADYAPDIIVRFDQGHWKTNEMVGSGDIQTVDMSSGEDSGAEGPQGYFCLAGPEIPARGQWEGASLLDVAPTVMDIMDLKIPEDMEGVSLSGKERSKEEEAAVMDERMKFSGY